MELEDPEGSLDLPDPAPELEDPEGSLDLPDPAAELEMDERSSIACFTFSASSIVKFGVHM